MRRRSLATIVAIVVAAGVFCAVLLGPAGTAQAFKPAAHFILVEKVRDALPVGSTIRAAIQADLWAANWGADGPDLGYAYWRMAAGYAPWGDRCHYDRVGSLAAKQLQLALQSGNQSKIAWAAGYVTHICGDMTVHGILVNPEAGVYLDGGNESLHKDLESYAEPIAFVRIGGYSESYLHSYGTHQWAVDYFDDPPGATLIDLFQSAATSVFGYSPSDGDLEDWTENLRDALELGGSPAYWYEDLDDAESEFSSNNRRTKLDNAFTQATNQAVGLLTAAESGNYSGYTDWWNLDASCTDGRPIGTVVVQIHTANEATSGTDDDVYFGFSTPTRSKEWELDKAGYNDFEQDDTDDYYLYVSDPALLPSQINKIWVRKSSDGLGGGWKLGDIEVRINGVLVHSAHIGKWLEDDDRRWEISVNWNLMLNVPPKATNATVTVTEDTPTLITLSGSDPEHDALTYSKASLPQHGTLSVFDGAKITYTPERDYVGTDSFTFRVNDGHHSSAPATVTITVTAKPSGDEPNDELEDATRLWRGVTRIGYIYPAGDSDAYWIDLPQWGGPHHFTVILTKPGSYDYEMSIAFSAPWAPEGLVWPLWPINRMDWSTDQRIEGDLGYPPSTSPVRLYIFVRSPDGLDWSSGNYFSLKADWTSAGSNAPNFPDVVGHKYRAAIDYLAERGIIGGFSDGTLGPDGLVTRMQFAKMISLALHLPVTEDMTTPFTDLGDDDPYSLYPHEYIAALVTAGITTGTTSTTFSPAANITLQQLVTMIVRGAGDMLDPVALGYSPPFSNFDPTHYPNARKAAFNGLFEGFTDPYAWTSAATRAQCALFLYNLVK